MITTLLEFMPEVFTRSEILIWNFAEISEKDTNKNIQKYMNHQTAMGRDPRDAFHRQTFNDLVLSDSQSRYLIGRYLENRADILAGSHIAEEGRTYHLAIDIFSKDQEPVFAPCDGTIVTSAKEPGLHNYGNYVILQPDDADLPYIFFGHLADQKHSLGKVSAGQQIGHLGSFKNIENGGWSVHLHLQLLAELPEPGQAPNGYTTLKDIDRDRSLFPDPQQIFPCWRIKR